MGEAADRFWIFFFHINKYFSICLKGYGEARTGKTSSPISAQSLRLGAGGAMPGSVWQRGWDGTAAALTLLLCSAAQLQIAW